MPITAARRRPPARSEVALVVVARQPVPTPLRQMSGSSAAADVLRASLPAADERHHRPQFRTHLLDLVRLALFPQLVEPLAAAPVLGHPFLGELAAGDLLE